MNSAAPEPGPAACKLRGYQGGWATLVQRASCPSRSVHEW